jgi:hypothetical protein
MRNRFMLLGASALCASLLASSAGAVVFDAVAEFGSTNPSGVWSYGERTAADTFIQFTNYFASCSGNSAISCFMSSTPAAGGVPAIHANETSATTLYATVVHPLGVLNLHPGPNADIVLRFTAPTTGDYAYSGFFQALDTSPTGVRLFVGDSFTDFTGAPASGLSAGGVSNFSGSIHLLAGDTFDFAVGPGADYHHDSTGLALTIGPAAPRNQGGIPELPTWAIMLLGFGSAGAMLRRRRRLVSV